MKVKFFPDTSTLFIDLADRPAATTDTLDDGNLIIDRDEQGAIVGITVDDTRMIPGFKPERHHFGVAAVCDLSMVLSERSSVNGR